MFKTTAVYFVKLVLLLLYVTRESQQTESKTDSDNCKVNT